MLKSGNNLVRLSNKMAGNMENSSRFPKGQAKRLDRTDVDSYVYEPCDSQDGSFPNEPGNPYGSLANSGYYGVSGQSDGDSGLNNHLGPSQSLRPFHRDAGPASHAEPGSVRGQFPSETGLGCDCRGCVSGTMGRCLSDREHFGVATSPRRYGTEETIAALNRPQFQPGTNPCDSPIDSLERFHQVFTACFKLIVVLLIDAAYAVNVDIADGNDNAGPGTSGRWSSGTSRSPFTNPYAEYALHRPWGTGSRYYRE